MRSMLHLLANKIEISINPDEAKYIVTCVCKNSYLNYESALELIKRLDESIKISSNIRVKASEILTPFPTLVRKVMIDGMQILEYFETMKDCGHNMTSIEELTKIMKNNPDLRGRRIFKDLINHAYDCSVQLGRFENGRTMIYSPLGLQETQVDTRYLKDVLNGSYFTTHGKNEDGLRIAIRYVEDPETISSLKKLEYSWRSLLREVKNEES